MSISPSVRSSKVVFDGALMGGHQTGRTALSTSAVDNIGNFVAPCDLTITQALIHILASTTSSAAKIAIGDSTASNAFHDDIALNGKAAGTVIDLDMTVTTGAWTKKTMKRGEALKIKAAAATAAGAFAASLVYVPTAQS